MEIITITDEIKKALSGALNALGTDVKVEEIALEHPTVEERGDYSTNIAMKLKSKKIFLENIEWFVKNINKDNFENYKDPVPIGKFSQEVRKAIGTKDNLIYLKPKVYAKVNGWLEGHEGHKEIGASYWYLLPLFLYHPSKLLRDKKSKSVFHFVIDLKGNLDIIVDLFYWKEDYAQVSSIYFAKDSYLKNFEEIVLDGGTAVPSYLSDLDLAVGFGAGSRLSSLHQNQEIYNKLDQKSQEEILFYEEKLNPKDLAEKIVNQLRKERTWEAKAEGGFINFKLSNEALISSLDFENKVVPNGKKIVIELVSPNINKPLHIGHLRNAALGMTLANLYKMIGWEVVRDEINNDRGLHIMKAAYGYLLFAQKETLENKDWKELLNLWVSDPNKWKTPKTEDKKPDFFVGEFYVLGEKFLTENEKFAGEQLAQMLQSWEAEEKDIWQLWRTMSAWVHEGIDQTYKRIGVVHDKKWYEHLLYKEGREYILEAVNKGILEKLPDGAVQANLAKYGLENKILIRRDGTAIYMTFDIALTKHKVEEFKADKYVWIVGNDQIDHFKRLFVIFEMLSFGKRDDFYHLAYGMVRVPGGKMSSRLGNVILAEDLLDKVKEIAEKFGKDTAEAVALGAVKYAMLKVNPLMDVVFDLDKSISLEGDSGPYLQYTYARAKSVLRKSASQELLLREQYLKNEELAILRWIYRFPEVVEMAAKNYAPNLVCSYLFELAKRFNNLYNNCPIIGNSFRLMLTSKCAQVLKNGLNLLGIETLERM